MRDPHASRFRWTPQLGRLLGKMSDRAVARRARASLGAVVGERKRRGIPAYSPHRAPVRWTKAMIRLIGTESDRRVAAELGVPEGAVGRKRRLLGIPPFNPRRNEPPGHDWTADEDAILGTISDHRAAGVLGLSVYTVSLRRRLLRIRPFAPPAPRIRWTKRCLAALGRQPDRELAQRMRVSSARVKKKRLELGIAAYIEKRPVVRTRGLLRLLRLPSALVRRETGLKFETIQKLRQEHGIEAPRMSDLPWSPAAVALLGKVPDAQLAREIGVAVNTVKARRKKLGISSSRSWRRWTESELRLLRTALPAKEVARRLGRGAETVRQKRRALGLGPGRAGRRRKMRGAAAGQ